MDDDKVLAPVFDDLRKRSARGGFATVGGQLFRNLVNLGATAVLARLLVPADFGLVAMVAAVIAFLGVFRDVGLSAAIIQRDNLNAAEVSSLFWVNVAVSVAFAGLVAAAAPAISAFYGEDRIRGITAALAIGVMFGGLGVQHRALLSRRMRFGVLAGIDLGSTFLASGGAVAAAFAGAGYWALVIQQIAMPVLGSVMLWIASPWRPGGFRWTPEVKELLTFGGNLTGFNLLNYLSRNADNVLIGWRWGAGPLGLYTKSYQLLLLPLQQINSPVTAVAVPTLSRLHGNPERYRAAYLQMLGLLVAATAGIVSLLIATSDLVVDLVLGPGWEEAARLFGVLGLLAWFQPVASTSGWLFISQDRSRDMLRWGIWGSAITLASFVAGLPWGAFGVALAYVVSGIAIRTPLLLWFVTRRGPVSGRDILRTLAAPALGSGLALGAVLGGRYLFGGLDGVLELAASAAVGGPAYLAGLALTQSGRSLIRSGWQLATLLR